MLGINGTENRVKLTRCCEFGCKTPLGDVDWALVGLMTVALFVLFNYRLVFDHTYNELARQPQLCVDLR